MLAESLLNNELQYGAFGLCVMLVALTWALIKSNQSEFRELGDRMDQERRDHNERMERKDEAFQEMVNKSMTAINRHSEALEARPCLYKDRAFKKASLDSEGD